MQTPSVSRRHALQLSLLSGAAALWPWSSPVHAASAALSADVLLVDTRLHGAEHAFAATAAQTLSLRGDLTDAWFTQLDEQTRAAPICLAGLTDAPLLHCLEQLTRDRGLRTTLRIEHHAHQWHITAPADSLQAITQHLRSAPSLAAAATACLSAAHAATDALHTVTLPAPLGTPPSVASVQRDTLWLLRPRMAQS